MALSDNLTFNTCLPNELEQITKLAHQIWPYTFTKILSEEQIQYMLNWMYNLEHLQKQLTEGHLFYLARKETELIGFAGLERNYPSEGCLRIHKLYLLPSQQGKNLGKWMMNQIEEIAKENDLDQLHLNVNRFNPAVYFYSKMGFDILGEEDIDIGHGFFMNDFVMRKSLH